MKTTVIKINPTDNVYVALTDLKKGEIVNGIELQTDVPVKHKFAETDFAPGDLLKMYGLTIGKASQPIRKGEHITTFNVKHVAESYSQRHPVSTWNKPDISKFENRTFQGFHRPDGRVGTANYWVVVPMVFLRKSECGSD
ncbi:SAF domain-containing protein [Pseudarcicella hirudinis]|uniref:SAF domain-containing protein n=1 Tax=Pseudarcicella hirudinis TaxID=1079859 RepID=UPI0035EDFDB3